MKKQSILIVDDVPTNIRLLVDALRMDYKVFLAKDGVSALRVAFQELPDLILLDVMMPEMDGFSVCQKLKADERTWNIPVIFITARTRTDDELRGLELGASDYITKPFVLPIVKARVRTHLDLKRKYDLLESLASLDGLTEIANRRQFDDTFDKEWRRGMRSSRSLSLIMMDIDFFKLYNDHYGHTAGDECLRMVAHAVADCLSRAGDFAARYGGEEFVALLPETGIEGAVKMAKAVHAAVNSLRIPHAKSLASGHVTLSLGAAAIVPSPEATPGALVNAADGMLYEAKRAGRNRMAWMLLDTAGREVHTVV
jgi:diguanylate cyclase (GGDEF)-like protein